MNLNVIQPPPSACGSGSGGGCNSGGCPAARVHDWLGGLETQDYGDIPSLVEVGFKGRRRDVYRNPDRLDLVAGDRVIVEADRGQDMGEVTMTGEMVRLRLSPMDGASISDLPKIVSRASAADVERYEANRAREAETFEVAREMVERIGLSMKVADVEWQFDRNKVTLYFTADRRVDFRKLVRELAAKFRTRVELRQIGARDEAARIGGLGTCGRSLCCSTWLDTFEPVAMHAAKVQDLPLNPARLSGQCGRLKCCLNYELEQYVAALKHLPRVGRMVVTDSGKAQVQKVDIFRSTVLVRYSDGGLVELPAERIRR